MNITTKFSVGDRAYYVIYATASINAVDVHKVYPYGLKILYDVKRAGSTDMVLKQIPESDLLTFTEARTLLIKYLQEKLALVENLVAP